MACGRSLPVFEKCCFCILLRPGLLVLAYIKSVLCIVYFVAWFARYAKPPLSFEILLLTLLLMINFLFEVLFIVGTHTKNHRIMNAYYIYSLCVLCIFGLISTSFIIYLIYVLFSICSACSGLQYLMPMLEIAGMFIGLLIFGAIEFYLTLLVRSAMLKWREDALNQVPVQVQIILNQPGQTSSVVTIPLDVGAYANDQYALTIMPKQSDNKE